MEDSSEGTTRPAGSGEGVKGGLLALATAAVVTVYAAGYVRTEAAAERFAGNGAGRGGAGAASATGGVATASAEPSGPAQAPVDAGAAAPAATPAPERGGVYQDGVYTGWGTSQHGRIEATVEVADGRIVTATISNCRMRWPCARIAFLVPQPVERQSAEVDVITRVTDSSDAFYYALVDALSKAR